MEFKLNEDDKKKWVDALRSGNFKQGKGDLHIEKDNSFCCLGVAMELGFCTRNPNWSGLVNEGFLPISIQHKLAGMNDGEDSDDMEAKTFLEIADYIEENL